MSRLQSFVKLFNFHETNISIYFLSDVAAQTNGSCYYCVTLACKEMYKGESKVN